MKIAARISSKSEEETVLDEDGEDEARNDL